MDEKYCLYCGHNRDDHDDVVGACQWVFEDGNAVVEDCDCEFFVAD